MLHNDHEPYGSTMSPLNIDDCINETCPWSGKPVQADSLTEYGDDVVGFCNPDYRDKFEIAIRHFENAKASRELGILTSCKNLLTNGPGRVKTIYIY